jgi:hypothetical protein
MEIRCNFVSHVLNPNAFDFFKIRNWCTVGVFVSVDGLMPLLVLTCAVMVCPQYMVPECSAGILMMKLFYNCFQTVIKYELQ